MILPGRCNLVDLVRATFIPDGDDTAAGIVLLHTAGHQVDLAILRQFENDDHLNPHFSQNLER
jgi:hypothetical protein